MFAYWGIIQGDNTVAAKDGRITKNSVMVNTAAPVKHKRKHAISDR